ncbi:unnamed protein product, partial [Rotaria magnacalcarata]
NAVIYSQTFTSGSSAVSQCVAWNAFRALLVTRSYSSLTISGSNNYVGITLTNPTIVSAIAHALRTNTTYGPISSNGFAWMVGSCGVGYGLTTTGKVCDCNDGYTVRPCVGNSNWGAINGNACNAGTQTMTITFI